MPGSRKLGKKHVGAWLDPADIETLKRVAVINGTDVSGLIKKIANRETIKVKENDDEKTIR